MENNPKVTIPPMDQEKSKTGRGVVILLVIIVLALGATVGVLFSKLGDKQEEVLKKADENEILMGLKKDLEDDLYDLQDQFGSLQTDNDSLKNLATAQQERITRLLAIQADNAHKIRLYQKELGTLREVLRSYVIQVDSLQQSNFALRSEKTALTRDLAAVRTQSERLTVDKERLTTTVQKAQILSVSDIATTGLNSRSAVNDRVRNIEKLRTCFTVRENQIADAGERTFYLVIVMPDNNVLPNRSNATFQTQNDGEIVYTAQRTIEYENRDIEMCIFSDNEGRLTAGRYEVRIYYDGNIVGSSTFVLR